MPSDSESSAGSELHATPEPTNTRSRTKRLGANGTIALVGGVTRARHAASPTVADTLATAASSHSESPLARTVPPRQCHDRATKCPPLMDSSSGTPTRDSAVRCAPALGAGCGRSRLPQTAEAIGKASKSPCDCKLPHARGRDAPLSRGEPLAETDEKWRSCALGTGPQSPQERKQPL